MSAATAGATFTSAQATAEAARDSALALADQNDVLAEQTAQVDLSSAESLASMSRASAVAAIEADYLIIGANAKSAAASALASVTGAPADVFQAAYAAAGAGWFTAMKPAYVAHETDLAAADGTRAVDLATAWKDREVQRAIGETIHVGDQGTSQATQTVAEAAAQDTYDDDWDRR